MSILLLVLLSLTVFFTKFRGQFLADDFVFLVKAGRFVASAEGLLTFGVFKVYHNTTMVAFGFRPFPLAALAFLRAIFGLSPAYYHAVILLVHVSNSVLLYFLARKFVRERTAFVSAAIFVVFTGHLQAVQWMSCISELFGAFFFLGSILLLVHFLEGGRLYLYGAALVFALLAFLSKESTVTLPAIAFSTMLLVGPEKSFDVRRISSATVKTLPYVVLLSLYLVVRTLALKSEGISPIDYSAFFHPRVLPQYPVLLANLLVPHDRAHLARPILKVAAGVFLPAIAVILYRNVESRKDVGYALSWLLVTAIPSLGFINPDAFWTRFNYLPAVGFCVIVGRILAPPLRHSRRRLYALVLVLAMAAYSVNTIYHNRYWLQAWRTSGLVQRSFLEDIKPAIKEPAPVYLFNVPTFLHGICIFYTGISECFSLLGAEAGQSFYVVDRQMAENPQVIEEDSSRCYLFEWDSTAGRFRRRAEDADCEELSIAE